MTLLRECHHCNKPFEAQLKTRLAELCRACALECDKAYSSVLQYREHSEEKLKLSALPEIADKLAIPLVFIHCLIKDGQLKDLVQAEGCPESLENPLCMACEKTLTSSAEGLCPDCSNELSQTLLGNLAMLQSEPEKVKAVSMDFSSFPFPTSAFAEKTQKQQGLRCS